MPPEITRANLNFSTSRKVKWRSLSKKMDRFRRQYIVWLDRNNSEPVGQIERHFSAPVDIPNEFMSFPEAEPWRVELDLEGYARYLKVAKQEWEARYKLIRSKLAKEEPDSKAVDMVGPPPQDWRLVVLLSRGDPWCLGFTQARTPAVEAIIGRAPTPAEIKRQAALGPADLRLDPVLEALAQSGPSVEISFPDEGEIAIMKQPVEPGELDPEGELRQFMDTTGDESMLTGDIDDDILGDDFDTSVDLAELLEEKVDPTALGGKRTDPRKNRTKPGRE